MSEIIANIAWKILMWIWIRNARKSYGGPGKKGELFNTANFQSAISKTTGQSVGHQTARVWLVERGYKPGDGGCHWLKQKRNSDKSESVRLRLGE